MTACLNFNADMLLCSTGNHEGIHHKDILWIPPASMRGGVLLGSLLALREADCFALEDVQQRLRAFQNLHMVQARGKRKARMGDK